MTQSKNDFSVLATGLGGQGVMLLSKVIAAAACEDYPCVCRTESRGLSQRNGSVLSIVRFGTRPVSPALGSESADLILALDAIEAARVKPFVKPLGWILANERYVPPSHLAFGWRAQARDEEKDREDLRQTISTCFASHPYRHNLELEVLAREAGCPKGLNTVLLGAASHFLPVRTDHLWYAVLACIKPAFQEANARAFDIGRKALAGQALPARPEIQMPTTPRSVVA